MAEKAILEKFERLWLRSWKITDHHGNGYATPIKWRLALKGHLAAMTVLSNLFDREGRISDPFSTHDLAANRFGR